MASHPADDGGLPALPSIKTAPSSSPPPPAEAAAVVFVSPSASPPVKEEEEAEAEEEEEPSTPTSEESRLRAPTVCPPAPRKPAPAPRLLLAAGKRKSPSAVFVDVPRDLSAVFRSLPPKKRIRAW
ncbi:cyclin-dependent protein kinase inhibitor SMR10-like [Oryza brachyantha]|uniref:cyclin-dependent protein kinase inhibitor SMR10-like n=1 Tax=Oryza brachyantha TaxID=4533 RepID=UPI001ADCA6E7|nr:cyclin-dependent protein kinase inhibitor SMR10-like [Oryza brachyantha]